MNRNELKHAYESAIKYHYETNYWNNITRRNAQLLREDLRRIRDAKDRRRSKVTRKRKGN